MGDPKSNFLKAYASGQIGTEACFASAKLIRSELIRSELIRSNQFDTSLAQFQPTDVWVGVMARDKTNNMRFPSVNSIQYFDSHSERGIIFGENKTK